MAVPLLSEIVETEQRTSMSILGMPMNPPPSSSFYPERFNPFAKKVWDAMFADESFSLALAEEQDHVDQWYLCIQVFLKRCSQQGVFAFSSANINLNNDLVVGFLTRSRLKLAVFYKRSRFFRNGMIGRITRNYKYTDGSLLLTVSSYLLPATIDPTFEKYLLTPPFPRFKRETGVNGLYTKHLAPNVDLFVRFYNRQRVEVGYKIFCHQAPFSGNVARVPNRREQTQFTEQQIWLPIVRRYPIADVRNRPF